MVNIENGLKSNQVNLIRYIKYRNRIFYLHPVTSISAARKLLLLGTRQKIHSGHEAKVWEDPWVPTTPARQLFP